MKNRNFSIDDNGYFNFVNDDWRCPICGRESDNTLSEHHLIPRSKKGRETVTLHRICHDQVHALWTENELARDFNTIDKIMSDPRMQKFAKWAHKKPLGFISPAKMSNKRNPNKKK